MSAPPSARALPATFSPAEIAALRTSLDGRWSAIRDRCRELAAEEIFAPVYDLPREQYRARVFEQMQAIAKIGLPLLAMPASVGGQDDVGASVTGFEMLAYGDLSLLVKAGVQWGLFGGAILHLGTAGHHERYLSDVASLELPGCFAMTETGHGSDVAALRTTATYDPAREEFILSTPIRAAYKDYIGNAARDGRAAVVFAQLRTLGEDRGVHAFVVPIRDADGAPLPGVTIKDCGPKAGLEGVDNGRLAFDSVRVPRADLLDRFGAVAPDGTYSTPVPDPTARFFTMLGTLVQGRISVAGGAGSAARVGLAIAVRYAEDRRQFRSPGSTEGSGEASGKASGKAPAEEVVLLDYQAHQRKLLPLLATSYALHFAQLELVESLHEISGGRGDEDGDGRSAVGGKEADGRAAARSHRRLESRAAGIKAMGTWHATRAIQTAREACGGAGYLAENRLPALKADTDVFTTFEGDNTVLLQLVAKELLTQYRTSFGALDTLGTIRFVADHAARTVLERTAARALAQRLIDAAPGRNARSAADGDLLDRGQQLRLFADRETSLVDGLARRLRRIRPGDADAFARFNAAQDHLLAAARASVERVILEAFVAGIAACPEPGAAALLNRVCDLYALSTLEADRAWFLEHGRLTARRSRALAGAVNRLCAELRPHARLLVDAFGIPEAALAAPIAQGAERVRQEESRRPVG